MSNDSDIPRLGDILFYYDENKHAHTAIVAFVHPRFSSKCDRPILNLSILKHDGRITARTETEPAYDDGTQWRVIEKWSWPEEVPADDYNPHPAPGTRRRQVGITDPIPTH